MKNERNIRSIRSSQLDLEYTHGCYSNLQWEKAIKPSLSQSGRYYTSAVGVRRYVYVFNLTPGGYSRTRYHYRRQKHVHGAVSVSLDCRKRKNACSYAVSYSKSTSVKECRSRLGVGVHGGALLAGSNAAACASTKSRFSRKSNKVGSQSEHEVRRAPGRQWTSVGR